MTRWVAIAYGALDLRGWHENHAGVEVMLLATVPSEPLGLIGAPASLWRRLVAGPVADTALTPDERLLVREFASVGLASGDEGHPARVRRLEKPWLSSPLHEMVYALVASVARDIHIGVVAIKGPTLHRQGLRDREHSGDVDIWVHPDHVEVVCHALEQWGWNGQADQWSGLSFNHSTALEPGEWGCEVDVHRHIPGCSLSDDAVFASLVQSTETTSFAGVDVLTPDLPAHAVLLALHELRPEARHGKPPAQAHEVAERLKVGGVDSLDFAREIKALAVLEPSLRLAFPRHSFVVDHKIPLNWKWRESRGWWRAYWMIFASLSPSERRLFVQRAVWPQREALAASEARAGRSNAGLIGARVRRLRKLLRW
ncbi:nucleotidyltransferase family protein [Paenarthrobacter ilicis]|uniref:nucleotidyltransferase family protein n=1 Tax=Paenarthrobacter ilicis TaxID=43665 RepID=UPI0028D034A1|nr:nucleotidyltransferase family protein [Paenarthrobacter ilicis]